MRLDELILENWLCHTSRRFDLAPLTVFAGPHESGKSAIRDGIGFALLSELGRVKLKGESGQLVTKGRDKGFVTVGAEGVMVSRDIATRKLARDTALPLAGAVTDAIPYCIYPDRFAALEANDRRSLLLKLLRVDVGPDQVRAELLGRGHQESFVKRLRSGATVEQWAVQADKAATEARGAWRGVTKDVYGDKKAEEWRPVVTVEAPDPAEIAQLRDDITSLDEEIAEFNREIGAIDAAKAAAEGLDGQFKRLDEARREVESLERALAGSNAELEQAKANAAAKAAAHSSLHERLQQAAHLNCPHCRGAVRIEHGNNNVTLVAIEASDDVAPTGAEVSAAWGAAEAANKLVRTLDVMVRDRERTLAEQRGLVRSLSATTAKASAATDLRDAGEARESRANATAEVTLKRERLTTLENAERITNEARRCAEAAREHHLEVVAWVGLRDALEPSGIPGELLAKALAPFNKELHRQAMLSGWGQVTIMPDMDILVGGFRYGLISESAKWRADAMLGATIAKLSRCRFLILDRFDVLLPQLRGPALAWLYGLTKPADQAVPDFPSADLDTAIVLGAAQQAPGLPPDARAYWLGEPLLAAA